MDGFFSVIKMLIGCGTFLVVLLILVGHLPNSPVRTLLVRICSWGTVALCGAMVASPIDLIIDIPPLGYVDDLIYLVIAYQAIKAARNAGKQNMTPPRSNVRVLDVKSNPAS